MDSQIVNQLKELKSLVAQGILTQEEFEAEKKKLLAQNSEATEVEVEVVSKNPIEVQTIEPQPIRVAAVPITARRVIMTSASPEEAAYKYKKYYNQCLAMSIIGGGLCCAFLWKYHVGGFWPIFGAVFWALIPGLYLGIFGLGNLSTWSTMQARCEKMSMEEFIATQQDTAERNRQIGVAVGQASKSYAQATGGRNMWVDLGSFFFN